MTATTTTTTATLLSFRVLLGICLCCFLAPTVVWEASWSGILESYYRDNHHVNDENGVANSRTEIASSSSSSVVIEQNSASNMLLAPEPQTTTTTAAAAATTTITATTNFSDSAFPPSDYTQLQEPFRSYRCLPQRIHISQQNNVRMIPRPHDEPHFHRHNNDQTTEAVVSMTVSFSLDYKRCGPHSQIIPKIMYRQGFHPEKMALPTGKQPLQFNFTSSVDNIPFFQSDWIYHIELPNLKAGNHRYWYRIEVMDIQQQQQQQVTILSSDSSFTTSSLRKRRLGESQQQQQQRNIETTKKTVSSSVLGTTPTYSFLTPPLPLTPTSIALVGDLGQTKNSTRTLAHIYDDALPSNKNPTTLLLIAGDMAYADSDPHRWSSWFDLMEPLTRVLPLAVAAGNHEIECDNATRAIFQFYEHYFWNPNRIADADMIPITDDYKQSLESCSTPSEFQGHYNFGNAFYSFVHGYIHFIILSSYSDTREGSPQYNWLQYELGQNVNRTETPWLIVSFHSPLYTTFMGHVNETQALQMKKSMEPLFNQYNVNLVICGHDHGYMRTHSLNQNGTVDPTGNAPIYLTLGAGGNRELHAKGYIHDGEPEEWVARRDLRDYGYGNLLVVNASHALLNWIRDGVADDGAEDKNVWIVNPHQNNSSVNGSST